MKTTIKTLKNADWDRLERDVVARIRMLRLASGGMEDDWLSDKIAQDLFYPCLQLLAEFCTAVEIKIDGRSYSS